jgi:hypothetical protein
MRVKTRRSRSRGRFRWLKWLGAALLVVLIALGIAISIVLRRAEPFLRAEIVEALQERFHAHVELDSFQVSLLNGLRAHGKGLRIWPPTHGADGTEPQKSGTPLISLQEFWFRAPLHYSPGKPVRISVVQLRGLDIDVPPKTRSAHAEPVNSNGRKLGPAMLEFVVESIDCKTAHLTLETSKPGKLPLEFDIARVKVTHVTADRPMQFDAQLTNPRPAGTILTSGAVGPWSIDDLGETPVAGNYRFQHADLGVFKGIAGMLASTGNYDGTLRNITVNGETDTPDFRLTDFGTPMPLHTQFRALVDGTNGDTWLQPVNAILGQSHFTVQGRVVKVPQETAKNGSVLPGGHEINLTVNVDRGRMEDFLRLTSKNGVPLLNGVLTVKTAVEIPPGAEPVHERMKLNGDFLLEDAEFSSTKFQNWVGELSMRGQGRPKDAKHNGDEVRSDMQSDFTMDGGIVNLPDLKYTVPGAEIDLSGKYGLTGGTMNFMGIAKMDATVSEMVGGWKGALLKPADRIFKKDGAGTEIPIHIDGTREDPKFGVDLRRMKHTEPAVPGQPE